MSELVQRSPARGDATSHGSLPLLIPSLCIFVVGLAICVLYLCKRRGSREPSKVEENSSNKCPTACTFAEVQIATDGFSNTNLLGRGRYAAVYRAISPHGHVMAVKRIDPGHVLRKPGSSFASEMKSLSRAQHPRIVSVIGYCEAPAERIIVTEYADLNSLDYHLHDRSGVSLDWCCRVRIASQVAQGIEYLHEASGSHIVHGAIKPSNILLDSKLSARVADFGLSFLGDPRGLEGSGGYLDPEYCSGSSLCKASDVYALGVVLLELLSGRRCLRGDSRGECIVEWAVPLVRSSRAREIFDPNLEAPRNYEGLVRMARLASACVSNGRKDRPTIMEVAVILKDLNMECMAARACALSEHVHRAAILPSKAGPVLFP